MLISVVIPTYNREKYILESVQSVLRQRLPDGYTLEVIVVDDDSTDNTVFSLSPIMENITYIRITSSGGLPAVVRNVGLSHAKGQLIAFQDSDDIWAIDKLSRQLPAFEDAEVVLSCGNAEFISKSGKRSGKKIINQGAAESGNVFHRLLENNFISTLTVIARSDAIKAAGGFSEKKNMRYEDYELWLKVSLLGKVHYQDDILAFYREHASKISVRDSLLDLKSLIVVFRSILHQPKLKKHERQLVHVRILQCYKEIRAHSAIFDRLLVLPVITYERILLRI